MKYFIYIIIGIVTVAVVAGFFVVGSPTEERLRRRDDIRIGHLQFIQGEIVNYWLTKKTLPPDLTALKDDIRGIIIPTDPDGGEYVYEIKNQPDLNFALCATFAGPSSSYSAKTAPTPVREPYYYGDQNWEHAGGYQCFERAIDKDIYPPYLKTPY